MPSSLMQMKDMITSKGLNSMIIFRLILVIIGLLQVQAMISLDRPQETT